MIRKFLERRKAQRLFRKLASPEVVEKLLHDKPDLSQLRHGRIEFIVAFVRGESPEVNSKRAGRVSDIAAAHGAMNHGIIGALVVVAFGTHPNPTLASKHASRLSLIQLLQQELGPDIKIAHGAADGHYGLFGSEQRLNYTFLVPQFDQVLGKLSLLEFGEAAEVL